MTFSNAVETCLSKKYATFSGRASRSEYWWFGLFVFFAFIASMLIGALISPSIMMFLYVILLVVFFIPSLAVLVRRLHDTGRSGWWALINLVPYVGGIVIFVFTLLESGPDNEYGSKC